MERGGEERNRGGRGEREEEGEKLIAADSLRIQLSTASFKQLPQPIHLKLIEK